MMQQPDTQRTVNKAEPLATSPPATDVEIAPSGAASTLFWMLPGPSGFLEHVTLLLNRHRAVAIHLSERTVLGHQTLIDRALARSSFDSHNSAAPVTLRVHDASQIECDIAQHLCASDSRRQISPAALAEWHSRRGGDDSGQPAPHTIVLRPRGEGARQSAWAYLSEFAAALPGSVGNTRIILLRIDNEPGWRKSELAPLRQACQFDAASFDGALGPDEMTSYLGMRMAIAGVATASSNVFEFPMKRLARALIAEFAGFDAHFAEGLMCMSEAELMDLPQSLGALATRMPVSDAVWRQTSSDLGTLSTVDGLAIVHTLHEWHLASHDGPHQKHAARDLERKKWRAHLSALMPWFEELRHALIEELHAVIDHHLQPTQGKKVRIIPHSGREIRTDIRDLECGDIVAMTKEDVPLRGGNARERAALDLCFKVSRVRNEIAHLRAPPLLEIQKLMECLQAIQRA